MAEWLDLHEVALRACGATRTVALRGGQALSHEQFRTDVRRWHAALARHAGTKLALYFEDTYDFATALFGAWHAGKQVVLPGDAQPATLARLLPQVDACAGLLPGAIEAPPLAGHADALPALDDRQASLVIHTSGSSGQPLAVCKRLSQLQAEVVHLQQAFADRLADQGITVFFSVSHQHIYGLLFAVLWPLAAGRAMAVERVSYPHEMALRLGTQPSVLVSSPAHLRRLPQGLDWRAAQAYLRAVFSSGGPLPADSAQQVKALLGQSPIEVYGSSETGGVAWRQRSRHGDAWTALPGVRWRVRQQILHVCSAHLGNDDWWETADRAQPLDGGGFLLLGRVDRIAKVEEKRVSLTAVEQAVAATGLIAEARAVLTPSDFGQKLALVAVPTGAGWQLLRQEGKRALNERLRGALLQVMEHVALPKRMRYVRALPVDSQGKTTEAQLLALFEPTLPQARWLESGRERAVLALDVSPRLRVFDGHFPGKPILAGVVQLDWAIAFAADRFNLPPVMQRVEQLKFSKEVTPPAQLQLTLEWRVDAGQLTFRYASAQGVHSSGRLIFGSGDV